MKSTNMEKLPLSNLKPFNKHPFKLLITEKMQELANSISERGIITPIIVRPIDNDKYVPRNLRGSLKRQIISVEQKKKVEIL